MSPTGVNVVKLDPHVEKKIEPLVGKIRDLALRRGDGAFRDVANLLGVGRKRSGAGADLAALAAMRKERVRNNNHTTSNFMGSQASYKGTKSSKKSAAPDPNSTLAVPPRDVVKVSPEEFKLKIADFGIVLTTAECSMLLLAFKDAVGYLLVSDLFEHLRNTLNERRLCVVAEAFTGTVSTSHNPVNPFAIPPTATVATHQLFERYQAEQHPLALEGSATPHDLMQLFMDTFDDTKAPDGVVTWDEFRSYYAAVSCGVGSDDAFEEMLRGLWGLYERPPTPPKERCFVPRPNSPDAEHRWDGTQTRKEYEATHPQPPRRVVGYTGHVPGAHEHFGETFYHVQEHVPRPEDLRRARGQPECCTKTALRDPDEKPLPLRQGNKANNHSIKFA